MVESPAVGGMFSGHFEHAVDDKGRVAVPVQFREVLSGLQEERLVATKFRIGEHRCLDVYPFSAWRRLEGSLLAKNRFDPRYVRFSASTSRAHTSGHRCAGARPAPAAAP